MIALTGDFAADAAACAPSWSADETGAASRALRERFLRLHAGALYARLTDGMARHVRVDALAYAAADIAPGLAPTRARVVAEAGLAQKDKRGVEIDQGVLLAHLLADGQIGQHLCHAMLLPRADSVADAAEFQRTGMLHLATARVWREDRAVVVETGNPRFLNAEDDATLDDFERAIDVAIMDPHTAVAILRGGHVQHPKYAGRRVFNAGINLTHLYQGRIPFLWYLRRDLGVVNKLLRGLAHPDVPPDDARAATQEKPWIAAVDTFAIGGGCQILLVMDYVLAERGAYMTLPARKEGIVPGAANLRLPRFTGERMARRLIAMGHGLDCDSAEGRLLCDEIADPADMDAALARVVRDLTTSGAVGLIGNRRALRSGAEPLDVFRRYMAVYAREQASCHFSPALIANLEQHWNASQRRG